MKMSELRKKVRQGVSAGIAKAIAEHKRKNQSIVVLGDNGEVIEIPPEQINLENAGKFIDEK